MECTIEILKEVVKRHDEVINELMEDYREYEDYYYQHKLAVERIKAENREILLQLNKIEKKLEWLFSPPIELPNDCEE